MSVPLRLKVCKTSSCLTIDFMNIMMPMIIGFTRVKTTPVMIMPSDMPPDGHAGPAGTETMMYAVVHTHVPRLRARYIIRIAFQTPARSDRERRAEIAYEKTPIIPDPA